MRTNRYEIRQHGVLVVLFALAGVVFLRQGKKKSSNTTRYASTSTVADIFDNDREIQRVRPVEEQASLFRSVSVSSVKSFWDKQPCNSAWEFPGLKKGTKEWFLAVEDRRYKVEPHSYDFAGFKSSNNHRVLEIGGGICTDSLEFAKHGADMTIVDLSTESLSLCKKRFAMFNQRAHFYQGSAMELDTFLPQQQFDVIYSYGVIHHMPEPSKCVCQLKQYLKPDGELRIMLYTKFSYKLFQVMREHGLWDFSRLDAIIAKYSEAQSGSPVTYTYTYEEARDMFSKCGFKITDMWKDHIFQYDIEKYRENILEELPEFKGMSLKTLTQMKSELGWHLMIKATHA